MAQNFQLGTFGQYVSANATANSVTFSSNSLSLSTNTFTIGTGSYFISNGNVGIGTSSPSNLLTVLTTTQYGSSINILESTSLISNRAGLTLGNWVIGQDLSADTTRDFFIYDGSGSGATRLKIGTDGAHYWPIGVWHKSVDGANRFYYSSSSRTYFGSANGYEWRNSSDASIMQINDTGYFAINGSPNGAYRFLVQDSYAGVHGAYIYNATTSSSATSRLYLATNVSNCYGLIDLVNNGPQLYLSAGTGVSNIILVCGTNGVYLPNAGTQWFSNSDETLKDIIEPIIDATSKISTLRTVIGKFKTDPEGTRRSMLIAQDVQKVLPEAVMLNKDQKLGLSYVETIPLLIASIKELNERLNKLEGM